MNQPISPAEEYADLVVKLSESTSDTLPFNYSMIFGTLDCAGKTVGDLAADCRQYLENETAINLASVFSENLSRR